MLNAVFVQTDSQQHQTIAQLAMNLVYKLLKGHMDGSDGPDAPYNSSCYAGVSLDPESAHSIIRMCRYGSVESRHGALAVLQQILTCKAGQLMTSVQTLLISLGVMPMLFGIVQAPESTAEMRTMATTCLAGIHSDQNVYMATIGTHCLIARLIAISLSERRAAANSDRHSM